MTIYVFDTGIFIDLFRHYYPNRFPSLWQKFNTMIGNDNITSTCEVFNELNGYHPRDSEWITEHKNTIFPTPTAKEGKFVLEIFKKKYFRQLINKKKRLKGGFVADPFIIARAKTLLGVLSLRKNIKTMLQKFLMYVNILISTVLILKVLWKEKVGNFNDDLIMCRLKAIIDY